MKSVQSNKSPDRAERNGVNMTQKRRKEAVLTYRDYITHCVKGLREEVKGNKEANQTLEEMINHAFMISHNAHHGDIAMTDYRRMMNELHGLVHALIALANAFGTSIPLDDEHRNEKEMY
jgi:hypothetical protein